MNICTNAVPCQLSEPGAAPIVTCSRCRMKKAGFRMDERNSKMMGECGE